MLVDKYEVMWFGSQKSVRWFCLDLVFFFKKTCVQHLQITKYFPVLLFLYSSTAHLKLTPLWQHFFLSLHSPPSSSDLPDLSFPASYTGFSSFDFLLESSDSESSFLKFNFFSFPCLLLRSHPLLRLQSAICRVGDKPQVYIHLYDLCL